jgi:hypothetical protein
MHLLLFHDFCPGLYTELSEITNWVVWSGELHTASDNKSLDVFQMLRPVLFQAGKPDREYAPFHVGPSYDF